MPPLRILATVHGQNDHIDVGYAKVHRIREAVQDSGRPQGTVTSAFSGLIWNDLSSQPIFRMISKAASKAVEVTIATVDHSDIRGSEPHNRDPSGATSD
jgi:hypothetical protein